MLQLLVLLVILVAEEALVGRRLRREAERASTVKADAKISAAGKVATEEEVAVEEKAAEKADGKNESAEKADAEKGAAEEARAAEKVAAAREGCLAEKEVSLKGAAEHAERATTSSCGSSGQGHLAPLPCCKCDKLFTVDSLGCIPEHQCATPSPALDLTPPSLANPLPLCHYCCHLGSGDYPVHYYMQCMCDNIVCTCKCYCSGAQLEHKHQVFPARFLKGEPMDLADVPKAKVLADERTERLRGYCPACDRSSCVQYMKDDGLRLV